MSLILKAIATGKSQMQNRLPRQSTCVSTASYNNILFDTLPYVIYYTIPYHTIPHLEQPLTPAESPVGKVMASESKDAWRNPYQGREPLIHGFYYKPIAYTGTCITTENR